MDVEKLVKTSVFLQKTPAGGNAYYNKNRDIAIVVYPYKIRIYKDRREGIEGVTASCFNSCKTASRGVNSQLP